MVGALAIIGTFAGWLVLVLAFAGGPRLGRAARGPGMVQAPPAAPPTTAPPTTAPPAVVGLVAGRSGADLFTVTLLDLAARGWFRLIPGQPGPRASGPAMCEIPAQTPDEDLTPYELSAVTHLSRRADSLPEVPAAALADGFEAGTDPFLRAFRGDVVAGARRLGLTRPTFGAARKTVLCLLALIPAGVALIVAHPHPHSGQLLAFCAFYYVILVTAVARVGSERLTPDGQQALAAWQAHNAAPGPVAAVGTRDAAHAAALGTNPQALATFTAPGKHTAWSGYGERWRLVTIGDPSERVWPGLTVWALTAFCLLTAPGIPLLAFGGYEFVGGAHGIELGIVTGVALDAVVLIRSMSGFAHLPRFAEFDAMVLRQWEVDGGDEGSSYYVAVDDGFRPQAWAFEVRPVVYHRLPPGTIVHVRINERLNKLIGLEVVRPPATAAPR